MPVAGQRAVFGQNEGVCAMNYDNTDLYFLKRDALRAFGELEGAQIYARASKLYTELVVTTDYQKSRTYESQLKRLVYPVIAYYKTLLAFGFRMDAALGLVRNETEKAAKESGQKLADQMRPVFPYRAFKRNIKNFIEYKFPARGWKSSGLRARGAKITFQIDECMYYSITQKFGCSELCLVFCEYERLAFAGLAPQVIFECGGTLANGHDACSFCFHKGTRRDKAEAQRKKT